MMLRFFLLLFCCASLFASPLENEKGEPSAALLEVLQLHGVSHDGNWESIVKATQAYKRPEGKELFDLQNEEGSPFSVMYDLCARLGMTQTVEASHSSYHYAAVLGATEAVVKERYAFLEREWERGIRFDHLVLLTGDRPLQAFESGGSNETEMMLARLPNRWEGLPLTVVNAPKPCGKQRPNTSDTYRLWMEMVPQPGSVLAISTQPFVGRQQAVADNNVLEGFYVETVGPGFSLEYLQDHPGGCAILWETIIRWIFEEHSS
ncbi:MAG: hypothetical protein ACKVOH_03745 [Chlamydiales bacterium]